MADLIDLVIHVTEQEQEQIKAQAVARGFDSVDAYLKALVERDTDERSLYDIREGIKQGLREALRGEYITLEQLWNDDDE